MNNNKESKRKRERERIVQNCTKINNYENIFNIWIFFLQDYFVRITDAWDVFLP